ncbi:alpha/beta hydrolase [Aliiglaciecola sp. 3_MG-2023]|uniref:alpha/beta fold hydrolase n=1 Tax=Aliiglaciecola sp. 3_MG-2023 TaxID=3062644 RepID=UPI0026E20E9E|nr:alpha/beta hydrolase [Aliiglaciecola sp. 3_MG-2023]MDO6693106.1 alpha/beta hydrolase [Aliiglaciecola sp. 3_MG-2023]
MIKSVLKWTSSVLAVGLIVCVGIIASMRAGWWNPSFEDVQKKHATAPSKFVMVEDVELHVRDEGQGPVIIMLHSSMTNLRIYDEWADRLKTDYRVIRIDWPPYGLSTDPKPSQGMPSIVKLLEKFVAQEGLDKFTLVGSSSGSTISVLYTASHPEQVRALALSTLPLSSPPTSEPPATVKIVQYINQNWVPNYLPKFYYKSSLGWLYGVSSRLTPETLDWYYETNNIDGKFALVKQYYEANLKAVWSKGAGDEAAQIKVPILLQWGDIDPVLPIDLVPGAVAEFKNTKVEVIHYPDVGHYPMLELPDETGQDLKTFIDKIHAI